MTSRNNLVKLFAIFTSPEEFRIDCHLVEGVVVLDRWDPPHELREPESWHLSYYELVTERSMRGADRTPGCHRVIRYTFGGLAILVKGDIDAYLPVSKKDLDTPTYRTSKSSGITVHRTSLIPPDQESLVSIKTRHLPTLLPPAITQITHFPKVLAQLLFSQIPHLHIAYHDQGNFSISPPINHATSDPEIQEAIKEHEKVLRKVAGMLRVIVAERRKAHLAIVGREGKIEVWELGTRERGLSEMARGMIREANGR